MKILLINTVPLASNGISTFIINSAIGLSSKNIDVTIATSNLVDNKLKQKLYKNNIKLVEFKSRNKNPFEYFRDLESYLKNNRFDVVHVNGNSTTMAIELFAAKLAKVKLRIAHSHNTTTEDPTINTILNPLFKYSINGRLACNDAAGRWLYKSNDFVVIRNGIDLDKYKYSYKNRLKIRKQLGIDENEILLGHIGVFNFQKNQSFLIKLLNKLPQNYKLILIGDGADKESVEEKVKKNNLTNRVIFTGNVDNIPAYLSAMDLFLLPSRFEGQPFVLIEATASGLKNIVSDKVSKETNICDNTTYLNLEKLSDWKNKVMDSQSYDRNQLSNQNSMILKSKEYDISSNVSKLIEFYNKKCETVK